MSVHSYSRIWIHLIWATLDREPMLPKQAAAKASHFLTGYAREKGIYMKTNYFNAEHTHALIDLPTGKTVEEVAQLFKGRTSHWINEQKLLKGKFSWGRGYGAFSVSHSDLKKVADYIATQEEHHSHRTFEQEYNLFVRKYGLEWREE
jgi:putative transposase